MRRLAESTVRGSAAAAVLLGASATGAQEQIAERAQHIRPHTIERLYSYPRLIGTAPSEYVWSPDGSRLAFLWNDEGREFRDVWLVDGEETRPRRLTHLPRPSIPDDPGGDIAAIEREMRAERHPGVTALVWQPDGQRVLFTFEGELYAIRPGEVPVRVVAERGGMGQLRFSPDGRLLSFLRAGRMWVGELRGDSLTSHPIGTMPATGAAIQAARWSLDSRTLAIIEIDRSQVPTRGVPDYLTEEPTLVQMLRPYPGEEAGHRRLGLIDVISNETRWVELDGSSSDLIFGMAWSPDSRTLVVDRSDLFVNDRRILLVDARSGASRLLHRELDTLNVTAQWQVEWAPDGRGIYFLSDRDEDYHIYHLPITGGPPARITSGNWAVFSFHVSETAHSIFLVGNRGRPEERHIFRVGLRGGPVSQLSQRAGNHAPVYSPDGRRAAVSFSSDDIPPDLYVISLNGERAAEGDTRVTRSPLAEFEEYRWVGARYVTFPSHVDGKELHGRLILPPHFDPSRRYPAVLGSTYSNTVLNQWGGRTAHPNWGVDQYLAQQGFVILQVDVRGSAGHGRGYRRRIRLDYGGIDVEDLHSGVRYLGTLGYVDTTRVGIWGSSYGGLMTAMSLFRKPGVYRAGVAAAPATNVRHALTGEMRVMESPARRPAAYDSASAITFASGLRDRLLILHGMRDRIVLFKDSMTLLHHLILMEKNVDVVVLPDAQHAWTQESSRQVRFAYAKLVEFLEQHVGGGGEGLGTGEKQSRMPP